MRQSEFFVSQLLSDFGAHYASGPMNLGHITFSSTELKSRVEMAYMLPVARMDI